jgi:hypothetical protein
MLQRVFVADLDLDRLARAEAKAQAAGTDSIGTGPDGTNTDGNGAGDNGSGNGPGKLAGGRAALDGHPDGGGP